MSGRVNTIDRVAQAITVGIQSARAERAHAVGGEKTHQCRTIGSVTVTQQIQPGHRIQLLAVEPCQAEQSTFGRAMPVRAVGAIGELFLAQRCQHALLLVGTKQLRAGVRTELPLPHKRSTVTHNTGRIFTTHLIGDPARMVVTLRNHLVGLRQFDQIVEAVVMVATND
ncbi:hypothetical protein D3C81_1038860 [compost metagenome]